MAVKAGARRTVQHLGQRRASKPGDVVAAAWRPNGRFYTVLDAGQAKHYVAFAAGSGITPILVSRQDGAGARRRAKHGFTLLYTNKDQSSVIF